MHGSTNNAATQWELWIKLCSPTNIVSIDRDVPGVRLVNRSHRRAVFPLSIATVGHTLASPAITVAGSGDTPYQSN